MPPFPPFFPLFPPNDFEDKETRISNLKMIRKVTQKWLQTIDEEIKKLESETGEKANQNTPKSKRWILFSVITIWEEI